MDSNENEKDNEKTNGASAHKSFNEKVKEFKKALSKDSGGEAIDLQAGAADPAEDAQSDLDKLAEELEESKKLCADYLDKLRRNMAEFDNFRKRTTKEKATMYDEGVKDTFEKLIPILDNFELALNTAVDKRDNFYKGVDMILRQFQAVLFDSGIEEIPALGSQFDPTLHNAVAHISDDAFGSNEVIEEMRKGYKYKDKVLRHSMVKVAN